MLEKTKFEYSSLGLSLSKLFELDSVKNMRRARVILIMTVTITFTNFTKVMMNLKRRHLILSTIG